MGIGLLNMYIHRRGFKHVSSISRKRLVDGLCSNLSVLGLSIGALVSVQNPQDPAEHEASSASHRSALKAYAFFLSWLTALAEDEARAAGPDPSAGKAGRAMSDVTCRRASAVGFPLQVQVLSLPDALSCHLIACGHDLRVVPYT